MFYQSNKNFFLFLTLLLSLTFFTDISNDEIQPWDEGIYTARIKAIALNNLWFDQTEQAIGGLYSSAHPPLVVWSNAVFLKLFGNHEFAYRIATAFFGASTILLVFFFFDDSFKGFLAALILSASSQFRFYSEHTQLDIPLTFFILLAFFFWFKYENKSNNKYLYYVGIVFGLGLWTKIIVAILIPAVISAYLLYQTLNKQKKCLQAARELLIIISIGLILFLPWFILMYVNHGNEFINYYFFYHILERSLEGVENNTKNLGYFFYFNQLIVHLPVAVAFSLIFLNKKFDSRKVFLMIAVLLPFMLFTAAETKLATYILPIFPLISIFAVNNINERNLKLNVSIIGAIALVIFQFWSYFPFIRNNVKNIILLNIQELDWLKLLLLMISGLFLMMLYSRLKMKYALFIIFALQIASLSFSLNQPKTFSGIKYASEVFIEKGMTNLVHFRPKYHSQVNNPQVIHYFNLNRNKYDINYYLVTDTNEVIDFKSKTMIIIEKGFEYKMNHNHFRRLPGNDYYTIYVNE